MCVSTDYPHFDSNFPNVSSNVLRTVPREMAAQILLGGAGLWNFSESDFQKADAAMERFTRSHGVAEPVAAGD